MATFLAFIVLAAIVVLLVAVGLWLASGRGYVDERVRVQLEQQAAERRLQQITHLAMQNLVEEARQQQPGAVPPAARWSRGKP